MLNETNTSIQALSSDNNSKSIFLSEFSIIHQNIRSIRKNFDSFLTNLCLLSPKPNIILLSEVWITENESHIYEIPGYEMFIKTNENYRAGGIVAYTKNIECVSEDLQIVGADSLKLSFREGEHHIQSY